MCTTPLRRDTQHISLKVKTTETSTLITSSFFLRLLTSVHSFLNRIKTTTNGSKASAIFIQRLTNISYSLVVRAGQRITLCIVASLLYNCNDRT